MTHIPGNEDAPGFRSMPFNATLAAEPMRLCRPFVVVCTKNKTISIFSGEKTIAAFDVIFFLSNKTDKCWEQRVQSAIVSVNNCANGVRLKS